MGYYPIYYALLRVLSLLEPFNSRPRFEAFNDTLLLEVAKNPPNHYAAYSWTCILNRAYRE